MRSHAFITQQLDSLIGLTFTQMHINITNTPLIGEKTTQHLVIA